MKINKSIILFNKDKKEVIEIDNLIEFKENSDFTLKGVNGKNTYYIGTAILKDLEYFKLKEKLYPEFKLDTLILTEIHLLEGGYLNIIYGFAHNNYYRSCNGSIHKYYIEGDDIVVYDTYPRINW